MQKAYSTAANASFDPRLLSVLACPDDGADLSLKDGELHCSNGHRFSMAGAIPILLPKGGKPGHWGIKTDDRSPNEFGIDPFVQQVIGATGGYLYRNKMGSLSEYPIPKLDLPVGGEGYFLDIGCNWGRWSIAAARLGYRVVGLDPHLEAVQAAYRVAAQLGVVANFVVGDARFLPFKRESFDQVFSYSVLQHFEKGDTELVLRRVASVLKPNGQSLIQMANALGIRSLYHQMRRGFRPPVDFEVRYWDPFELKRTFSQRLGPSRVKVDGFFSVNAQATDLSILAPRFRWVVHASRLLKTLCRAAPVLGAFADSLFVESRRRS